MAKLNDRCFCCFTAAMLVPLGRAPTWRLHTKLYKFRRNSFPNNAGMKNRTDLNLGEVVFLSTIYHIPDSWLNLLNSCDFYFRCKPPIGVVFVDFEPKKCRHTKRARIIFCVIGAFEELFTVMIWLSVLVAMYSTKEPGNLWCAYDVTSVMVR